MRSILKPKQLKPEPSQENVLKTLFDALQNGPLTLGELRRAHDFSPITLLQLVESHPELLSQREGTQNGRSAVFVSLKPGATLPPTLTPIETKIMAILRDGRATEGEDRRGQSTISDKLPKTGSATSKNSSLLG